MAQVHGATDTAALAGAFAVLALAADPGPGRGVRGREASVL
jgi:hypothetical protein